VKEKLYILTFGILMFGCETKSPDQKSSEPFVNSDTTALKPTTIDVVGNDDESAEETIEKCNCTDFAKFKNYGHFKTDLSFYSYNLSSNKSDSIFNLYSSDSLRLTIKSIRFSMFDTIPEKFRVFKNVEHIVIESRKNIAGLDLFPKLKSVFFWGSQININTSEKWLNRLEGLYAEKSHIKGLQSFKTTLNLRDIYFGHAKLEPFPADFDQLKCLRRITLGAYRGDIDLSKIDLALNPCVEKVEFSTWYDAFSGIPKGLDTNRTFKIIINHQKLTKEEKEIIKAFNDRNKKTSP